MSNSYILPYLPIKTYSVERLFSAYGRADRSLARLDGMLSEKSYANVLLSPMMTQEAVLSSRIEGTRSTIDEVYSLEAGEESANASIKRIQAKACGLFDVQYLFLKLRQVYFLRLQRKHKTSRSFYQQI